MLLIRRIHRAFHNSPVNFGFVANVIPKGDHTGSHVIGCRCGLSKGQFDVSHWHKKYCHSGWMNFNFKRIKRLATETRTMRLDLLKIEFRRLIEFHAESFKDLDDKARYWLTITLPSFLTLSGLLIEKSSSLSEPLISAGYALGTCLMIAIYLFSSVLLSQRVESGLLAPPDRNFDNAKSILNSDKEWMDLSERQAAELVTAIGNNEKVNTIKSKRLRRAEKSLFLASPTAVVLAAAATLVHTTAGPLLSATPAASSTGATSSAMAPGIGIVLGAGTIVAFLFWGHIRHNSEG